MMGLGLLHRSRITRSWPTMQEVAIALDLIEGRLLSRARHIHSRTHMRASTHPILAFILSTNFRTTIPTTGGVVDSGERGAWKPPLVPSSNPAGATSKTLMIPTRLRPGREEGFSDFRGYAAGRVFLVNFICSAVCGGASFWEEVCFFHKAAGYDGLQDEALQAGTKPTSGGASLMVRCCSIPSRHNQP